MRTWSHGHLASCSNAALKDVTWLTLQGLSATIGWGRRHMLPAKRLSSWNPPLRIAEMCQSEDMQLLVFRNLWYGCIGCALVRAKVPEHVPTVTRIAKVKVYAQEAIDSLLESLEIAGGTACPCRHPCQSFIMTMFKVCPLSLFMSPAIVRQLLPLLAVHSICSEEMRRHSRSACLDAQQDRTLAGTSSCWRLAGAVVPMG
eukprot:3911981-Amphidinium_carterae.1